MRPNAGWVGSVLSVLVACGDDPAPGRPRCSTDDCACSSCDADGDGATQDADCDDADAAVHPGAPEVCNGVDDDCNGLVDDEDPDLLPSTAEEWHRDQDGDGAGGGAAVLACDPPFPGAVHNDDDCDDDDPLATPEDLDGDGMAGCDGDCDDGDDAVHPGAEDVCGSGVDANCDGEVPGVGFLAPLPVTSSTDAADVAPADVDGDGDLDLLVVGNLQGEAYWVEYDGGPFVEHRIAEDEACAWDVGADDLDGDGDLDVLCSGMSGLAIWESLGGGAFLGAVSLITSPDLVYSMETVTADLDVDGDLDVVGLHGDGPGSGVDEVVWFENRGDLVFSLPERVGVLDYAWSVATGDLDQDGDLDVVGAGLSPGSVKWFENDGTGGFAEHMIDAAPPSYPYAVDLADADGDGSLDVFVACLWGDRVGVYGNDGSGDFSVFGPIASVADGPTDVVAADVDADGDVDVVYSSAFDSTVSVHRNLGAAGWGPREVLDAQAEDAHGVEVADLDNDGLQDVIAAVRGDLQVRWYPGTCSE